MIRQFGLRNFKGHRDTQLALGRFTMLVGDNASGKTSVLDALALQAALGVDPVACLRDDRSPEDLLRRGSDGPITLTTNGTRAGSDWNATVKLQVKLTEPNGHANRWELDIAGNHGGTSFAATASGVGGGGSKLGSWDGLASVLGKVGLYRLDARRIAAGAYSSQPETEIEADGTNTAVVLAAMKLGNDEAFQRVESAIQTLVPSVKRLRIRPAIVPRASLDEVVGSKLYFDFAGARGIPAHGASHGTLIALALLTVLHSPKPPDLILLDDFDHALHPRAQVELVRMIKNLLQLAELNGIQIIATTHSPYVLDELDPSNIHVFALREDGTVAAKRLSEHPEADRTRGALKAGQLWSLDPERDWVLQD